MKTMARHHVVQVGRVPVRMALGEQLVEHHAQGVDVALKHGSADLLLGRGVRHRAVKHGGHRPRHHEMERPGDAEVQKLHHGVAVVVLHDEQVRRLQVAVDRAEELAVRAGQRMRLVKRVAHLDADREHVQDRERRALGDELGERHRAGLLVHDVVRPRQLFARPAGGDHPHDVAVAQPRHEARLFLEHPLRVAPDQLGVEELDDDGVTQHRVPGEVHLALTSAPEAPGDHHVGPGISSPGA